MSILKRYLSLILSIALIVGCFSACDKSKTSSEDESVLSGESTGEFDNTDENASTPTPGEYEDNVYEDVNDSYKPTSNTQNTESKADPYANSVLKGAQTQYLYEGSTYLYAITEDGQEVIAYINQDDSVTDILSGGGKFVLVSTGGKRIFGYNGIADFYTSIINGYTAVTVEYAVSASNTTVETTYIFENRSISVASQVQYEGNTKISPSKSLYSREFLSDYQSVKKKINYEWVYPENGDFPYQQFESFVTVNYLDDTHPVYTFLRDENAAKNYQISSYPDVNLPLNIESDTTGLRYTMSYDLVPETVNQDRDYDYLARFEGTNSEFATGIAPVVNAAEYDNTTVFTGDSVTLNINVTNLTEDDLKFSLRYDIRDYYGNIVDSGLFIDSTVFYGISADRNVKVTGKSGIYYLNLYAMSSYSTYYECYPFMLLPENDWTYRSTNAFGIDAPHTNTVEQTESAVSLLTKIGAGSVRLGEHPEEFLSLASKAGIRLTASTGTSADRSVASNKYWANYNLNRYSNYADMIDYVIISNEPEYSVQKDLQGCIDLMKNFWLPNLYDAVKDIVESSPYKIAWAATCHARDNWFSVMYDNGVWQSSDVIDTHLYSYPGGPDMTFSKSGNSIEQELQNLGDALKKYGSDGKTVSIGETGYPIGNTELRTQADFNTRIGVLAMAYGVDRVNYYCMFDRTGYREGSHDDRNSEDYASSEYNFGMFYNYDYYGVFKPKPWAAAFATMSDQLESLVSCSENTKYTTDDGTYVKKKKGKDTLRVFDIETKEYGKGMVAWSNVFVPANSYTEGQSSGAARTPTLPWNNQWEETETVTFDAANTTVTVIDTMGNATKYTAQNGKVTIEVSGSPIYIYGVK